VFDFENAVREFIDDVPLPADSVFPGVFVVSIDEHVVVRIFHHGGIGAFGDNDGVITWVECFLGDAVFLEYDQRLGKGLVRRMLEKFEVLTEKLDFYLAGADMVDIFFSLLVIGFRRVIKIIILLQNGRFDAGRFEALGQLAGDFRFAAPGFTGDRDSGSHPRDGVLQDVENLAGRFDMVRLGYYFVSNHGLSLSLKVPGWFRELREYNSVRK